MFCEIGFIRMHIVREELDSIIIKFPVVTVQACLDALHEAWCAEPVLVPLIGIEHRSSTYIGKL